MNYLLSEIVANLWFRMHEICVSDNIQSAIAMIEFPILEEIFIELPVLEVVVNKVELRKLMNGVVSRISVPFGTQWKSFATLSVVRMKGADTTNTHANFQLNKNVTVEISNKNWEWIEFPKCSGNHNYASGEYAIKHDICY